VLTLYRRHRAACPHSSKSRNAPRTKGCDCPIWVQGSLGGETIRESLNLTSWEAASERVRAWEASGEIGVARSQVPTIKEAVEKFIADAEARNLKPESIKKTRHVVERRLLTFCTTKGLKLLRQVDVDAVREFRNELAEAYSPNSARKSLEYVRSFFRFCHQSGWIHPNPAVVVKPPKGDDEEIETFEPEEVEAMLRVADGFRTKSHYGAGNRKRIRAMILLLRYSGIRISDAAVLARARLHGDKLSLRTIKTGREVWCPLPPDAVKALEQSVSDNDDFFFWNGRCKERTGWRNA
jgi:integrase/recombinase XerD